MARAAHRLSDVDVRSVRELPPLPAPHTSMVTAECGGLLQNSPRAAGRGPLRHVGWVGPVRSG
jgi:hypothetical protein